MSEQICLRTYEVNYCRYDGNPCAEVNCKSLNSYLQKGWKVVMVTPKSNYNEYIVEKQTTNNIDKSKRLMKEALTVINGYGGEDFKQDIIGQLKEFINTNDGLAGL